MMQFNTICLLAVMILTVIILKGIFCWMHFSSPLPGCHKTQPWQLGGSGKHEYLMSDPNSVNTEIPMEDIERTSTPVPQTEVKHKSRLEFHSDV